MTHKYLAIYSTYHTTGDSIADLHEEIRDEYNGNMPVEDIKFYQLTPIEVECKTTYTIKPLF